MKTHGLLLDKVYRTGKMTFYILPFTFLNAMLNTTNCIASGGNGGAVIAHEVFHDCGTRDIYTVENQAAPNFGPLVVPIREAWLPDDWGGGYYAPGLTQRDLITRLIMRSGVGGLGTTGIVLPRGTIYGWKHTGDATSPTELGQASVGQNSCTKMPGSN